MSQNALILIPDISGYTEFLTRTEIDHSSHILNEMLELIIESNNSDFTLSEIEGDAVLFYRKGDPLSRHKLMQQCLTMFNGFHEKIKLIERDSICKCGACQTVTNLSLKFIAHYGALKEIKVSHFTKASGVDMVIAHRLLKNKIDSSEYVLMTKQYLENINDKDATADYTWEMDHELFQGVGKVEYEYACLKSHKEKLPNPLELKIAKVIEGKNTFEVEIKLPMEEVYKRLINSDLRIHYTPGIQRVESDPVTQRVGLKHTCFFDGLTIDSKTLGSIINEDEIIYIEDGRIVEVDAALRNTYTLLRTGRNQTRLTRNVDLKDSDSMNDEIRGNIMMTIKIDIENFRDFCETSTVPV